MKYMISFLLTTLIIFSAGASAQQAVEGTSTPCYLKGETNCNSANNPPNNVSIGKDGPKPFAGVQISYVWYQGDWQNNTDFATTTDASASVTVYFRETDPRIVTWSLQEYAIFLAYPQISTGDDSIEVTVFYSYPSYVSNSSSTGITSSTYTVNPRQQNLERNWLKVATHKNPVAVVIKSVNETNEAILPSEYFIDESNSDSYIEKRGISFAGVRICRNPISGSEYFVYNGLPEEILSNIINNIENIDINDCTDDRSELFGQVFTAPPITTD